MDILTSMSLDNYLNYVYYPIMFGILGTTLAIVFVAASQTTPVDSKQDMYRGCVASAHQATMRGHDLAANLEYCEQYKD
jgi:hypothetical protein